jgi:hypothetical protein
LKRKRAGEGQRLAEARKTRSDKKTHVNPALDFDSHRKLKKLAISCNMTKTNLAERFLVMALNNPDIIKHFQDIYNLEEQYRITPIMDKDGRCIY